MKDDNSIFDVIDDYNDNLISIESQIVPCTGELPMMESKSVSEIVGISDVVLKLEKTDKSLEEEKKQGNDLVAYDLRKPK